MKSITGTRANTAGKAPASLWSSTVAPVAPAAAAWAQTHAPSQPSATTRAGTRAARRSRACWRASGLAAWRTFPIWAASPATATTTPKNTTKNCGWDTKLLRQQMTAATAVTAATTRRSALVDSRIPHGITPSGYRTTAHRYATPDTMWNVKCRTRMAGGWPTMSKTSWLGWLKVAAVPNRAKARRRGTSPVRTRKARTSPSSRLSRLNRYWTATVPPDAGAIIVIGGCRTRAA